MQLVRIQGGKLRTQHVRAIGQGLQRLKKAGMRGMIGAQITLRFFEGTIQLNAVYPFKSLQALDALQGL